MVFVFDAFTFLICTRQLSGKLDDQQSCYEDELSKVVSLPSAE
jgi:hypothetical protein